MRGSHKLSNLQPAAVATPVVATSPIHTPSIYDMGDGQTSYAAPGTTTTSDFENENDSRSGSGSASGSGSGPGGNDDDTDTSLGPDVEMRGADSLGRHGPHTAKERRLTLKQLERFRRAIAKNNPPATGGRAASASSGTPSSSRWLNKTHDSATDFDNVFGGDSGGPRELRIVSHPWGMWIFGLLMVIAAAVFVSQIHSSQLGHDGLATQGNTTWWKYLVGLLVLALGVGIFANGRLETVVLTKDTARLTIRSTKPLCPTDKLRRTRHLERDLATIVDIRVEASGEILSGDVDTRAYRIHIDFANGSHTTTLEGRSKKKALIRCRLIKQFLLSCGPVATSPAVATVSAVGSAVVLPTGATTVHNSMDGRDLRGLNAGPDVGNCGNNPSSLSSGSVAPLTPRKMVTAVPTSTLSQRHLALQGLKGSTSPSTSPTAAAMATTINATDSPA